MISSNVIPLHADQPDERVALITRFAERLRQRSWHQGRVYLHVKDWEVFVTRELDAFVKELGS